MQTETISDPRDSTGETTYFHFHINTLLVSNFLVTELYVLCTFKFYNFLLFTSFIIKTKKYLV